MPCATTTLTALALTLSISWIAGAQPTLYLTDARAGKIQTMDLAEGTTEDVLFATNQSPEDIAVDLDGGKMYWISRDTDRDGKIRRANLDGSQIEDLVTTDNPGGGLALDATPRRPRVLPTRLSRQGNRFRCLGRVV